MDVKITFCGRYGEHFEYYHNDDTYRVSCKEIDYKDVMMSKQEFDDLFNRYYYVGVPYFDKNDISKIKSRAINLGKELRNEFWFFKHNNGSYEKLYSAIRIYQLLNDSEILELNNDQYISLFLKENSQSDEEYVNFMLDVKKRLIDNQKERIENNLSFKNVLH